jgi:hypothetical protein
MPPRIRRLEYVWVDTPAGKVDEGPCGYTSDRACIEAAEAMWQQHLGAWLMRKAGTLDPGFRLLVCVQANGLDRYPHHKEWRPEVDAAMQWAGMDLPTRGAVVHDYRTQRARVIRSRTATPFERVERINRQLAQRERALSRARHPSPDRSAPGSIEWAPVFGPYCEVPEPTRH